MYNYNQVSAQGWPEAANIGGLSRIFVMRAKFFSNRTQKKIFGIAGKKRKFSIIGGLSQPPQSPFGPPLCQHNLNTIKILNMMEILLL
jgi:hypothetical protein